MMEETRLTLRGDMAKPFLKYKIGDKIEMKVTAVMTQAGMEPDYSEPIAKGEDKEIKKRPMCEFVIAEINGRGNKSYGDMSNDEMEGEIHKVKSGSAEYEEDEEE